MNSPRHPSIWRANTVRAACVLGAVLAACAMPTLEAKENSAPEISAPDIAMPLVTPDMSMPGMATPTFSMPTISASPPTSEAQAPGANASRRSYELKVSEHRRYRTMRTSHPERIDYADALIHLERYEEAIEELMAIEERYPDAYINAHLLGIASERAESLTTARTWFEAAVQRDPEAQEGTGWLRVAMIHAQLGLREDPTWLAKHSVLDGIAGHSEEDLIRAVDVQVNQRREFFAEHDPVLADLYFQVGARMESPEMRNKYFALSIDTGPLRQQDIEGQMVLRAQGAPSAAQH